MKRTVGMVVTAGVAILVTIGAGGVVSAQPAPPAPSPAASGSTYTVRPGDNLVTIARRLGVRLADLLQVNTMTIATVIHPGDTLRLPAGATLPSAASSAGPTSGATSSSAAPTAGATTYVVKSGDALASIAYRHGVKLGALAKANGLTASSTIHPGQSLQVPPATMPIPTPIVNSLGPVAAQPAAPPAAASAPTSAPLASNNASIQAMLTYLQAQVGKPYKFFSAGPDTFDCSGLVVAAYKQVGITLPHQSRALSRVGASVDRTTTTIVAGDLLLTSATGDPTVITHVGIALDSKSWIQAVGPGRSVRIGPLPAPDKILSVRRVIPQP